MEKVFFLTIFIMGARCLNITKAELYERRNSSFMSIHPLNIDLSAASRLWCASKCLSSRGCYSFFYHKTSGLCVIGRCLTLELQGNKSLPSGGGYYSINPPCDVMHGFQVLFSGDVSVCVYISTIVATYTQARSICQSKNAHLYTPKNKEKMEILKQIGNLNQTDFWCGLDDIVKEGEFLWDDDNTNVSTSWMTVIFVKDDPNNLGGAENCGRYYQSAGLFVDALCNRTEAYICEGN